MCTLSQDQAEQDSDDEGETLIAADNDAGQATILSRLEGANGLGPTYWLMLPVLHEIAGPTHGVVFQQASQHKPDVVGVSTHQQLCQHRTYHLARYLAGCCSVLSCRPPVGSHCSNGAGLLLPTALSGLDGGLLCIK